MRAALASLRRHPAAREVLRYLLAGVAITAASHLIYLGLLRLSLAPHVAWAISFICGVLLGYLVHGRYVFRVSRHRRHWITFPAGYLLRFAIGQGLLAACLAIGMTAGWAGFVTNVAMAPLGYFLLRLSLQGRTPKRAIPDAVAATSE